MKLSDPPWKFIPPQPLSIDGAFKLIKRGFEIFKRTRTLPPDKTPLD
jgi:hypothetical protein